MTFSLGVLIALIALPPVVLWLLFWQRQFKDKEPGCVLFQLFFFGVFSAVPLVMLREYLTTFPEQNFLSVISSSVVLIVVLALAEELVKGLALIAGVEINKQWFDRLEDGFEYAVAVALGFAFAENIMYFFLLYTGTGFSLELATTYFIRSLVTMMGHVLFTGAFGFAYAYAYLGVPKSRWATKPWKALGLGFLDTLRAAIGMKNKKIYSSFILVAGFVLAVLLHTGFNLLWELHPNGRSLGLFTVPLIMIGVYFYAIKLKKLGAQKGNIKVKNN